MGVAPGIALKGQGRLGKAQTARRVGSHEETRKADQSNLEVSRKDKHHAFSVYTIMLTASCISEVMVTICTRWHSYGMAQMQACTNTTSMASRRTGEFNCIRLQEVYH